MPATAEEETVVRPAFPWKRRLQLQLISWLGYFFIRLVGPTLRFLVSIEDGGPPQAFTQPVIFAFWHRCVVSACYFYRSRNIAVMTSRSFDGEYIARIIEKFGYRAVRGSSGRGAVGALLGMHRQLEAGRTVAFTIDGPRGPRYVAKPGPVLLARNTQFPIVCFHLSVDRAWVLNSWDAFVIPKPFSRVVLRVSQFIRVPADAGDSALDAFHAQLQATLDRIRDFAEKEFSA